MKWLGVVSIAVAAAGSGAFVNGMRWETRLQAQTIEQHAKDAAKQNANIEAIIGNQREVIDAISEWQARTQTNEAANVKLQDSVISLQRTVSGLRGDFSTLPGFLRDASQAQLQAYATTCTAVFRDLAEAGGEMARAGAELARQADRHAADAALISK